MERFALNGSTPEPWKNGRGVTRTLSTSAASNSQARGATPYWSWRISVAELRESGPFSVFEEIDRTLILLSGAELRLDRPNDSIVLDRPGEQVSFRGEEVLHATITPAPAQAFNVMTRRGIIRSKVRVIRGHPGAKPAQDGATREHAEGHRSPLTTVVFVAAGRYRIELYEKSGSRQTMILQAHEGATIDRNVYPILQAQLMVNPSEALDQPLRGNRPGQPDKSTSLGLERLPNSGDAPAPWLILTTLESASDSPVSAAP
jgi:environmental stress-induced protein Ves